MRTQVRNLKNEGKNAIFFGVCAKRAGFMRVCRTAASAGNRKTRVILSNLKRIKEKAMSSTWNGMHFEREIAAILRPERRPITVTFHDAPPANVEKFDGSQPSGCSFWRLAAQGRTFYTVPQNHFNCAVGAYTHNIALSPEREKETEQTLNMMFDLGYVKPQEVPQIPRLSKPPVAILYAPLAEATAQPDVVLFALKPASAMLLQEAATRAGVASGAPALGRPTCMALPASLEHGTITSLGCIGNRVYTGLGENEMYVVLRGKDLPAVSDALKTIAHANRALHDYAKGRREQLSTI
jgi:uncharacterized protein (DUF169 family)